MLRSHRTNLAVKAALGVILVILFISVVNMQLSLKELRELNEELSEQVVELKDGIEETNYRLSAEVDDSYIERYARDKLGLRFPNERIYYNDVAD